MATNIGTPTQKVETVYAKRIVADSVDGYLPSSGGAMTGNSIARNVNDNSLTFVGGTNNNAGRLILFGGNSADARKGGFVLRANNADTTSDSKDLVGIPNGSLIWGSAPIHRGNVFIASGSTICESKISTKLAEKTLTAGTYLVTVNCKFTTSFSDLTVLIINRNTSQQTTVRGTGSAGGGMDTTTAISVADGETVSILTYQATASAATAQWLWSIVPLY